MTPKTFTAELLGLMNRAKEDLPLETIHTIIRNELDSLWGDMWLYEHYNGDPPPRVKESSRRRPRV